MAPKEKDKSANALWITGLKTAEIRQASIGQGVLVQTLYSGISRGTERLVFEGRVPSSEFRRMRCFGQEGEFSLPVKYGYCAVGRVLEGDLKDEHVFSLHPHQDYFRAPVEMLHPLSPDLPAERAVLAANIETALNIGWDANPQPGEKIVVIGAGVIGVLTAFLLSKTFPELVVVDTNSQKRHLAEKLGLNFSSAEAISGEYEIVIHASATADGLNQAIELASVEGRIIEASWFGQQLVPLNLGGAFHSKRLSIVSSQVGMIPPRMRSEWDFRKRMMKALSVLEDPTLECLVSGETNFEELPSRYESILESPETLCHRVKY